MKIITLNIWGGKVGDALVNFIKEKADGIDIFCFQEVYNGSRPVRMEKWGIANIHSVLSNILSGYIDFHAEAVDLNGTPFGLAMFVKKEIEIKSQGSYEIFKSSDDIGLPEGIKIWNRLLQYVTFLHKGSAVAVFNLHGLYTGGGKDDTKARIEQSTKIKNFIQNHQGKKILCGDFNLNPETESLKILEEGMRNLIKENKITSTRTHHYAQERKFADYMLVSGGLEVKDFTVLPDVVSDHSPLYLEFI